MNPNDIVAQQQALLNQALNQQHNVYFFFIVLQIVGLLITAWVLYMFYARSADIVRELQKLRIAYEFASARTKSPLASAPSSNDESSYMPQR